MNRRRRLAPSADHRILVLALLLFSQATGRVRGAEPLETIREAARASSRGLTSGAGQGTYRHYEATDDGDWELKRDADVSCYFDGGKYHVELTFHRDEVRHDDARRIIHDGRFVMGSFLAPEVEGHFRFRPDGPGDGTARPSQAGFPWDVAHLAGNVWNPDGLVRNLDPRRIDVRPTREGDLVGSHPVLNADRIRVRFECPRRFGYNLARLQVFDEGRPKPLQEARLEWKRSPGGLWYIRSLDETIVANHPGVGEVRERDILKFTEFEPNAKVDPRLFTEEARRLMAKRPVGDPGPRGEGPPPGRGR